MSQTLRPLVLPPGELTVQRSPFSGDKPWLLLHAPDTCLLTIFSAEFVSYQPVFGCLPTDLSTCLPACRNSFVDCQLQSDAFCSTLCICTSAQSSYCVKIDGGTIHPQPLFEYVLPQNTLPGSIYVGTSCIFCVRDAVEKHCHKSTDAADGRSPAPAITPGIDTAGSPYSSARGDNMTTMGPSPIWQKPARTPASGSEAQLVVLSRSQVAEPAHAQSFASNGLESSCVSTLDASCLSAMYSTPTHGMGRQELTSPGKLTLRASHAAMLQALPMPTGVVMLIAPLAGTRVRSVANESHEAPCQHVAASPLGEYLCASRNTLFSLRTSCRPEAMCRRLLRPPDLKTLPDELRARSALAERYSTALSCLITEAKCRVAQAIEIATTFGLNSHMLFVEAVARVCPC